MLSEYRRVCYEDDGCDRWQCLSCYKDFVSHDNPEWSKWNFCPHCGVKWAGKRECRDHYTPRWQYKLEQLHGNADSLWRRETPPKTRGWVIEKRTVFWRKDDETGNLTLHANHKDHPGSSDWHIHCRESDYSSVTLADTLFHLQALRDIARDSGNSKDYEWNIGSYDEYRARVIDYTVHTRMCSSNIWTHRVKEGQSLVTTWNQFKRGEK